MKTVAHAFAAITLALVLAACGGDGDTQSKPQTQTVDAEDYTAGPATIVDKRVDPQKKEEKKERTTCKTRKNGVCKKWNYKKVEKVVDDTDYLLVLDNNYEVDVDRATYDSYQEREVYPRPTT